MNVLKPNDATVISSLQTTEVPTYHIIKQNITTLKVEINIYDADTNALLETAYSHLMDVGNNYILFRDNNNDSGGQIIFNTEAYLRSKNYVTGNYQVTYKFYKDILGSEDSSLQAQISSVSFSRTEISIKVVDDTLLDNLKTLTEKHFYQFSSDFEFTKYTNFGNNALMVILNSKNEYDTETNLYTVILKLYEPLPDIYGETTGLWLVELYSDEFVDTLTLLPPIASMFNGVNILGIPDFSNSSKKSDRTFSLPLNENNILQQSSKYGDVYQSQLYATDNSYLYGIELNVDYSNFSNFVHFGSAAQMLDNFRKKLELIQYYEAQSGSGVSSYSNASNTYYVDKKNEIIKEFTRYDRFLYFNSSVYFTSSLYDGGLSSKSPYNNFTRPSSPSSNLIIDSVWPKDTWSTFNGINNIVTSSGYPYVLKPVANVTASAWFDTMFSASMQYDELNADYLLNVVPEYIRNDVDANSDYISFINMTGEFYDNIWSYVNNYYRMLKRENKLSDALPNELIWDVLKNGGIEINQSHDAVDLGKYFYGLFTSGSSNDYTVTIKKAQKDISTEIWNRLLNNLPFLYKSKGTKKSIIGLLNCYGVPRDLLLIKEFGGPYSSSMSGSYSNDYNQSYNFVVEDFTHVVDLDGTSRIMAPWASSDINTVELKFKTTYTSNATMSLIEKTGSSGNFSLSLERNVNTPHDMGQLFLRFSTTTAAISSSIYPFFDGAFYNVFLTKNVSNYGLYVIKFDENLNKTIIHDYKNMSIPAANNAWTSAGNIYLAGNKSNFQFVGAMDEFRMWSETLTTSVMDWHSQYWPSSNGNSFISSLSSLIFRLSFNNASNLGPGPTPLMNEAYIPTASYYPSASAIGFPTVTTYPYNFSFYERSSLATNNFVAPNMVSSEKIRIEDNSISQLITLPDGYTVYPLRMSDNSNYYNLIYDKSDGAFVQISGEKSPFSLTDKDNDRLLIGFSPAQMINNDMIAFFGNTNLLTVIGNPSYMYEDYYPSVERFNSVYWTYTKNKVTFFDYINYIRAYDKCLFEQIMKFTPAQSTTFFGTVYDQTMIHRSRVRLISPETANDYDYGTTSIPASAKNELVGNNNFLQGGIDASPETTLQSVNIGLSTKGLHIPNSDMSGLKVIIKESAVDTIIEEIHSNVSNINGSINVISDTIIASTYQDLSGYYDYKFNPWNLKDTAIYSYCNNTFFSIFMKNTISTSADTPDNKPVIELTKYNSKQLKVNYSDNPKLIVS